MEIIISVNIGDKFLQGLQQVLNVIDQINQSEEDNIVLIFQNNVFVTPLFILPLLVYTNGCKKRIRFQYTNGYLNAIHLGNGGLKPEEFNSSEFQNFLNRYSGKTYIPIISFPTNLSYTKQRDDILSSIERLLINQLNLKTNIISGLKYLIVENVDNIIEHSESERGYIFSQSYPTKKYLDICIADNGITLLGSYMKMNDNKIIDHFSAMSAANSGISTKNLPEAENRGFGIMTSKNMLVNGLLGNFVMLSGNALYLKSNNVDQVYVLPDIATWQGTIVAMRIPYENENFNYIEFVE